MSDLPANIIHGVDQASAALRTEWAEAGIDVSDPKILLAMVTICEQVSVALRVSPISGALMIAACSTVLRNAYDSILLNEVRRMVEETLPELPD